MNWYSIFYWLTVSDGVKEFFDVTSNITTGLTIVTLAAYVILKIAQSVCISEHKLKTVEAEAQDPDTRSYGKASRVVLGLFILSIAMSMTTWTGYVLTPTKKDCLMIVAGGAVGNFLTSDTSASQIPSDITTFLHMGIQKEIANLNTSESEIKHDPVTMVAEPASDTTDTDRIVGKLEDMTKEELIRLISNKE